MDDPAAIVDAIDERTLLVPISHVLFKNGEIQDVEPIVRRAHEAGAHVSSTATSRPASFRSIHGARCRLCRRRQREVAVRRAGRRLALRRPDLAERLEPTLVGWQGHARPFAFEPELEYATPARAASSPARRTCRLSTRRPRATT